MLIGLAGFAKVGKDSICHALGWQRVAFADALKIMAYPVLRELGLDLSDPAHKALARPLLVDLGRIGRAVKPGFWIERLAIPSGDVCVTDIRYADEVAHVQASGGLVFRVHRNDIGPANDEEFESFREIERRFALPDVFNDGDIDHAAAQVQRYLGQ